MYTDVHMPSTMPITDFRKKVFDVADWMAKSGSPIDVQRDGKVIFRVIPVDEDSPQERAKRLLALAPKIAGIWKDVPQSEFDEINEFLRGKNEKAYQRRLKRRKW